MRILFVFCLIIQFLTCTNAIAQQLLPYVYLTFEEVSTSHSVTVNFMTDGKSSPSHVSYWQYSEIKGSSTNKIQVMSRVGKIDKVKRSFHHAKLDNLSADTTYYFIVGDDQIGFSQQYKFRTLPEDNSPITIVAGGDMGTSDKVSHVPQYAMTLEPHVLLIGGDLAYADGKTQKIDLWDQWFEQMVKVMITPNGYLVPLIVAIGNHEVTTGVALPWAKAPFYTELFAQDNGNSFFTRELGQNAMLLVLDSGHLNTHESQKNFIKKELKKYQDLPHRLALYHAPLYPNHRSENDFLATSGRNHWLSVFDKYFLTVAFENHDHSLKRSKILKQHAVSQQGTLYLGDGCWGKGDRQSNPQKWYLEKAYSENHVWSAEIQTQYIDFMATAGREGQLYDYFRLQNTSSKTIVKEL
ncbi:MAG: metallophosphoesterase family protein [Bdellovibrionales bacterium]|nr:metallophosphoesterase family protein [Bdellovibrionales bacterium]